MKINYNIEQCDNGIVVSEDRDDVKFVEVVPADDIISYLGKLLWGEINNTLDAELKNAADIEINITPREGKL